MTDNLFCGNISRYQGKPYYRPEKSTASKEKIFTRFVQVRVVEPFPEKIMEYLNGETILFENNRSAELGTLIKLNTGYVFKNVGLRYDGRPFEPNTIVTKIKEALN